MEELEFEDLKLGKMIGTGKFGTVFLVTNKNPKFPKTLAIKVIKKELLDRDEIDYLEEIKILSILDSDYIVQFYKYFENSKLIFQVFEYISSGDLYDKIKDDRLSELDALNYFKQIAKGLQYLHNLKIMHRDIKPENILIDEFNNVKITDFGFATFFREGEKHKTIAGTIFYLAPEIIKGTGYDYRVDIWALGILYYEMLVGTPPFYLEDDEELYKQILEGKIDYPNFVSCKNSALISVILSRDPYCRPTISFIINNY